MSSELEKVAENIHTRLAYSYQSFPSMREVEVQKEMRNVDDYGDEYAFNVTADGKEYTVTISQ